MEEGTTIIGMLAIALCIMPLIIIGKSKRKKERELLASLQDIAAMYGSDISTHDFGVNFAIGMADNMQFVFFYKKWKETEIQECIPFKSIKYCKVEKTTRSVKTKTGNEEKLGKLELIFQPKDRLIEPTRFEFFNTRHFAQPSGEIQLAKKWESIINERLGVIYD
ncbi:hypothetical protein [Ekhidna sp.]|jgi:hypothetical protein|uniref:hypothetical protein n=1 Tax=Ekhidna sp. TaxID=2608089 RepID=UPI0032ECC747